MTMWQRIKCWLGIKTHYLVSYSIKTKAGDGFGNTEIISSIPLDMFSIRDMEAKIKDNIKERRKDITDIESIVTINIIKLER